MKNILLLSFIFFWIQLNAQDTIVYKSGETKAVQILKLKKESNLIVYTLGKDTIYSSFKNIERFTMNSKVNNESTEITSSGTDNISTKRVYVKKEVNVKTYDYGTFSISTNLAALLNLRYVSSRMTIEPEYRINENFSVKTPIYIGILPNQIRFFQRSVYFPDKSYSDYSNPPSMEDVFATNPEDILYQVGINPKYYPFGKSQKLISIYISGAVNFGIARNFETEVFLEADTVTNWGITSWEVNRNSVTLLDGAYNFLNFEGLFGIDINFSKRITATLETGYSSRLIGEQKNEAKFYLKTANTDYELIYQDTPRINSRRNFLKGRVLLTYHF